MFCNLSTNKFCLLKFPFFHILAELLCNCQSLCIYLHLQSPRNKLSIESQIFIQSLLRKKHKYLQLWKYQSLKLPTFLDSAQKPCETWSQFILVTVRLTKLIPPWTPLQTVRNYAKQWTRGKSYRKTITCTHNRWKIFFYFFLLKQFRRVRSK